MSTTIEERVVAMKLQNSNFEANAKKTLSTLSNLTKSLKMDGAAKGLAGVSEAAKKTNLGPLSSAVEGVSKKFSAMSVIGVTALATIANKAVNAGLSLVKSLTIDPISQGFSEYELKLGSIQTILANTARYGTTLSQVSDALGELNNYADKTIYNFGDMTKNIGLFTNAGIRVEDATSMIKGFSNAAAASGTTAQGAAGAAYQLSQALSAGTIRLMDWRSLTNVGMGNKNMQTSLIEIADAMGEVSASGTTATDIQEDFNGSLKSGWLSADVMSNYLQIMAGDMDAAQMAALGLSKAQIKGLQEQAKTAEEAATKVRTFTQFLGTIREAVGSGWAQTFEILIGDFDEATDLFTSINNKASGIIDAMSDARNQLLEGWDALGGRTVLIEGLKNVFEALGIILGTVGKAFRSVFPATTAEGLFKLTEGFRNFTETLKMGSENADRLQRIFAGLFSILKIGWSILKFTATTLLTLFGYVQNGSGGFLELAATVGDFLVKIQQWLIVSGRLKSAFATINTARLAIFVPLYQIIGNIAEAFADLLRGDLTGFTDNLKEAFGGVGVLIDAVWKNATGNIQKIMGDLRDYSGIASEFLKSLGLQALAPIQDFLAKFSESMAQLRDSFRNFGFSAFQKGAEGASGAMSAVSGVGEKAASAWAMAKDAFKAVERELGPVADAIGRIFAAVTDRIATFIENLTLQDAISLVNTGFFILMFKTIRDFVGNLEGVTDTFKGIKKEISDTMGFIKTTLTDALGTLQTQVKANLILKIAIAIGILAASLWVLAKVPPEKLAAGVAAIGVLLFALNKSIDGLMSMMEEVEGKTPASVGQLLAAGGAILLLAGAILMLSHAVQNLSQLSWEEMAKGLISVGVLIGALGLFSKYASLEDASLKGGANLILLAAAVYLLSHSVEKLAKMDRDALIQGGIALAGMIAALTLASRFMGQPESLAGAAGMVAMAAAISLMVPALAALGALPMDVLIQGGIALATMLTLLVGATKLMGDPKNMAGAAGMIAMAIALNILVPALAAIGLLPLDVLIQGMVGIFAALLMMSSAARALANPKILGGAAALILMSVAITLLVPALAMLGALPTEVIVAGLLAMAAAFAILLLAAAGAMYVAPGLWTLAGVLAAFGAAMLMAGLGMLAFGTGFTAMVAIGTAGFAVLTAGFMSLLSLLPVIGEQVGYAMIAFAKVISNSGPVILEAITVVLIAFLAAIEEATPQFMSTMRTLILGLITTVQSMIPELAASGVRMILRLLGVIETYVGPMARKATDLMIAFIQAIGREVPRLVDAGAKMVIDLLNGIAEAIRGNSQELEDAGANIASAIVDGMVSGIGRGISEVSNAARNLARNALNAAKSFLGIASPSKEFAALGKYSAKGYAKGLDGGKDDITKAAKSMQDLLSNAMKKATKDVADLSAKLKKLNSARRKDTKAIAATKAALKESRAELSRVKKAQASFNKASGERKTLKALAVKQEKLVKRIEKANKALEDAKKARDDFAKSTKDQYDNLPSIDKESKLSDFVSSLEEQIVQTQIFTSQLATLRKMGLSDEMYRLLLSKGTDAVPFAKQLLEGGQSAIDQVNTLGSALDTAAKDLSSNASIALYQAGVDAAQGLVDGLVKKEKALEATMDKLAARMVSTIKRKLGIKSPSRVFAKIGQQSVDGLAQGFESQASVASRAASSVGAETINSLRKTLNGLSELVDEDIDTSPTIRPVLDLSQIRRDSIKMGEIMSGNDVSVKAAFAKAVATSNEFNGIQNARAYAAEQAAVHEDRFTFIQNNTSPKALSEATIYRQTKNQISTAKGALKN